MKRNNSLIMERDMDILTLESTEIKVLESANVANAGNAVFPCWVHFPGACPLPLTYIWSISG